MRSDTLNQSSLWNDFMMNPFNKILLQKLLLLLLSFRYVQFSDPEYGYEIKKKKMH
tara:strand:+ start:344 stop:511 length:168 start_codon:yes stop_codon:yes gene_type:complete